MRDPFKPNSNKQLIREAQFGFTVIGLLVATLIYVAWFRLNGLHDETPEYVRNSPVAMQVFPNSPNYDRETHTMRSPNEGAVANVSPMQVAPSEKPPTSFAQMPLTNSKLQSPMVTVPKRIMYDSNQTARSLKDAAESIEQSANRVATLTNPPQTKKPFGLVSNPAAKGESDSGFKVLKKPEPVVAKPALPIPKETPTVSLPLIKPPPLFGPTFRATPPVEAAPRVATKPSETGSNANESSTASRFNTGSRFGAKPAVKTPVISTTRDIALPKTETSNDFRPVQSKPFLGLGPLKNQPLAGQPAMPASDKLEPIEGEPVEPTNIKPPAIESKPVARKPFSGFGQPKKATDLDATIPRLPKLPDQSLNDLRSSTNQLTPTFKPTPSVETVSFEQATWKVKKGDSFWSIAQSNYGDGRFFRALYEKNRRLVPGFEDLAEGVELDLPTVDQLVKQYPDLCPGDAVRKNDPWRETPDDLMEELTSECDTDLDQRFYETKSGDTLFEVARRQLGQASRYVELIKLNEFRIDANVTHETRLPSGTQLLLPKE